MDSPFHFHKAHNSTKTFIHPTTTNCNAVADLSRSTESLACDGLINDVLVVQNCNAIKIVQVLRSAFNRAQSSGKWGHHYHHRELSSNVPALSQRDLESAKFVPNVGTYYGTQTPANRCLWTFSYELQLITKTLSYAKAKEALEVMCDAADQVVVHQAKTTKWEEIERRLMPAFMHNYTNGGSDLNTKIGNFQNPNNNEDHRLNRYYPTDDFWYSMGLSIDLYYRNGARTTALEPVDHLNNCKNQAVMCCFGGDRQSDDNNGNCAKTNCDNSPNLLTVLISVTLVDGATATMKWLTVTDLLGVTTRTMPATKCASTTFSTFLFTTA